MDSDKERLDFVGCSVSVATDTVDVTVHFKGAYPLEIDNHVVFCSRQSDEMCFACPVCGETVTFSEAVWKASCTEKRRRVKEYAIGHFYETGCRPGELSDAVDHVVNKHVGKPATEQTTRNISNELKQELSGHG